MTYAAQPGASRCTASAENEETQVASAVTDREVGLVVELQRGSEDPLRHHGGVGRVDDDEGRTLLGDQAQPTVRSGDEAVRCARRADPCGDRPGGRVEANHDVVSGARDNAVSGVTFGERSSVCVLRAKGYFVPLRSVFPAPPCPLPLAVRNGWAPSCW